MQTNRRGRAPRGLSILLLAYAAASLLHHVHNAQFLAAYPSLPAWLTPAGVYAAWLAVTAMGLCGYLLLRGGYALAGPILLALYAALGLDGLGHYAVAPISAHSPAMNLSILLEVVTAAVLLSATAVLMAKQWQSAKRRRSAK
jgi:hypothetical protein